MAEDENLPKVNTDVLWYLDNYILLRDYYDRTISRIAARCVRMGNIAMEEYPFYGYILDVLEEISDTGDYIIQHKELYPYVEKKIKGGMEALKKNLREYKLELKNNSSPDMIKEDAREVEKMKAALGNVDKSVDPTVGAGMNMEELMEKLTKGNQAAAEKLSEEKVDNTVPDIPPQQDAVKKIVKIKKVSNEAMGQAVPPKEEVTE